MRCLTRAKMCAQRVLRRVVIAIAASGLLIGGDAFAGDYSVIYAIDANGTTDAGKLDTCTYVKTCEIRSEGLRMRIELHAHWPDRRSVVLTIYGPNGCCYSADANDEFYVDVKPGLQKLRIYAGRRRQQNEFVLNERFGILYVEISDNR